MLIRVEGLPDDISELQLLRAFQLYGVVARVEFRIDRFSRGKPVGFVEMPEASEGELAIRSLRGVSWGIRSVGLYRVAD